jgi:hypothetical protein
MGGISISSAIHSKRTKKEIFFDLVVEFLVAGFDQ